jgi:hypothetical protein
MTALEIIKNIYVNPRQAFVRESLDETFNQALLSYIGLVVVGGAFVAPWIAASSPAVQQSLEKVPWMAQHLRLYYFGVMVVTIPLIFIKVWLVQYFARKRGAEVAFKPLISGQCWIGSAMMIPSWLLGLVPLRGTAWIIMAYGLALMALCIQSLTGFSFKVSAWILLLALLAIYGSLFCLALVFGLVIGLAVPFIMRPTAIPLPTR